MVERVLDSLPLYESTEHYLTDQLNQSESFEQYQDAMRVSDWVVYKGDRSVVAFENEGLKTRLRYYFFHSEDHDVAEESALDLFGEIYLEKHDDVEVVEMEFPGKTHPGVELKQILEGEGEKDILKA